MNTYNIPDTVLTTYDKAVTRTYKIPNGVFI